MFKQPLLLLCRAVAKKHQKQFNFAEELKPILDQYSNEVKDLKEKGLDSAADYFIEKLEQASPVRTGELRHSWVRTYKYKGVRYIGSTASAGKNEYGYDIPLSNILEYSVKGHPFIRATFEANKENIIKIIKETIENGKSK